MIREPIWLQADESILTSSAPLKGFVCGAFYVSSNRIILMVHIEQRYTPTEVIKGTPSEQQGFTKLSLSGHQVVTKWSQSGPQVVTKWSSSGH